MEVQSLSGHLGALSLRWSEYRQGGSFEQFVEFTLALNSLTERLSRLRLPGLVRQCEGLENASLTLFGNQDTHPIPERDMLAIQRQVDAFLGAVTTARRPPDVTVEQRVADIADNPEAETVEWVKPRSVWLVAPAGNPWAQSVSEQLSFYGFRVTGIPWGGPPPGKEPPFAVVFAPDTDADGNGAVCPEAIDQVARMRNHCQTSQFFYVGVPRTLDCLVALMRAGVDVAIQRDQPTSALLSRILDLVQTQEQERYRVLVVEDSRVAVAQIQRTLNQHGIDSQAVADPGRLFEALDSFRPDLVLMDMYMPICNGVEATRALRQLPAYQSIPIVYLSAETDVALQVEALRLGGDQFLTKPFNPVLLASTVKTSIERRRAMQRASRHDGLTGLLNHASVKAELEARLAALPPDGHLSVAMVDIDHFKSVNDTYGHPVGDQVIRSLAWLLRGRLRATDLIGRYGGEEFLVAFTDARIEDAATVLDRIRTAFGTLRQADGTFRATFSAGIAAFPQLTSTADLVRAADEALLEAKRRGRNQVVRA